MTCPSVEEIAGALSRTAQVVLVSMSDHPEIWQGDTILTELHANGLAGNMPGTLNPLGRAVAKLLKEKEGG